ncbi:MAG: hypothetical protein H6626_06990 [Pseudobdellovibrionaceae bacterium]|nr:hypothetical protein [Bdellovibrionales bacterium]USN48828.1 MAG: hypothetical protein H6626_06990 [Pseudobdellovibrionaceae bacterium]
MSAIKDCRAILDVEYQERVWIRQEGPEWDTFYEKSIFLGETLDVLLQEPEIAWFSEQQIHLMKYVNSLLDETEVEFADGTSRGGSNDRAPDWLKLQKAAKDLIRALSPYFLDRRVEENFKVYADGPIDVKHWMDTANNPFCGFSAAEKASLMSTFSNEASL